MVGALQQEGPLARAPLRLFPSPSPLGQLRKWGGGPGGLGRNGGFCWGGDGGWGPREGAGLLLGGGASPSGGRRGRAGARRGRGVSRRPLSVPGAVPAGPPPPQPDRDLRLLAAAAPSRRPPRTPREPRLGAPARREEVRAAPGGRGRLEASPALPPGSPGIGGSSEGGGRSGGSEGGSPPFSPPDRLSPDSAPCFAAPCFPPCPLDPSEQGDPRRVLSAAGLPRPVSRAPMKTQPIGAHGPGVGSQSGCSTGWVPTNGRPPRPPPCSGCGARRAPSAPPFKGAAASVRSSGAPAAPAAGTGAAG